MIVKIPFLSWTGKAGLEIEVSDNEVFKLRAAVIIAVKKDANLRGANLRDANLRDANLIDANLRDAYMRGANLRGANLRGANLRDAYMRGANLTDANLRDAYMRDANLRDANLIGANLRDAYMRDAYMRDANLTDAENLKLPHFQIPQEGSLIGWKAASGFLIKVEVPAKAKRTTSVIGRKCRAEFVKTIEIYNRDGEPAPGVTEAVSGYNRRAIYKRGRLTKPDRFDPTPLVECTNGVHFFLTKEEAEEWL